MRTFEISTPEMRSSSCARIEPPVETPPTVGHKG